MYRHRKKNADFWLSAKIVWEISQLMNEQQVLKAQPMTSLLSLERWAFNRSFLGSSSGNQDGFLGQHLNWFEKGRGMKREMAGSMPYSKIWIFFGFLSLALRSCSLQNSLHVFCSEDNIFFSCIRVVYCGQLFLLPCGESNKLQLNTGAWRQGCPCSA